MRRMSSCPTWAAMQCISLLGTDTPSLVISCTPSATSCTTATIGSDDLGVRICVGTDARLAISTIVNADIGAWMFISSPSKSALNDGVTHAFSRNVACGITRTLCAIMLPRHRLGCRLSST